MTVPPREIAQAAIRDGAAWNDRRLPECGRALNDALDRAEAAEAERDRAQEINGRWWKGDNPRADTAESVLARVLPLLIDLNAGYDNAETTRQTCVLIEEINMHLMQGGGS